MVAQLEAEPSLKLIVRQEVRTSCPKLLLQHFTITINQMKEVVDNSEFAKLTKNELDSMLWSLKSELKERTKISKLQLQDEIYISQLQTKLDIVKVALILRR